MPIASPRQQLAIGASLGLLLIASRGYHFQSLQNVLPSASWAVFFLAGVYLRPLLGFALLLALAAATDYVAIVWGGVSDFCVSPAYAALLPAYGCLWLAGRAYAARRGAAAIAPLSLAASAILGSALCELISSGSFYVFSGRFAQPALAEFAARSAEYFPAALYGMAFWIAVALAVQASVAPVRSRLLKR
ncbi:MAG TPA: hypothetical protein VI279_16180 [Rhodocyclaceae bacterium]